MVVPAIDEIYDLHREIWLEKVHEAIEVNGFHLSGDGQYDSRGYSALLCKYVLMCASTKLIVDFSVKDKRVENGKIQTLHIKMPFIL